MTSTKVKAQHLDLIKRKTGELGADYYVDINMAGKMLD